MTANDKRANRRVPVALRIRLRYQQVDQFISKFAVNISRGGMFLASRNPKPIGTELQFEMRLVDNSPLIAGVGEVRWISEYDKDRPAAPHGMGIRFLDLNPESRVLIERIVEHRRSLGTGEQEEDAIPDPRRAEARGRVAAPPPAPPRASEPPTKPAREPAPAPEPQLPPPLGAERARRASPVVLPDIPPPRRRNRGTALDALSETGPGPRELSAAVTRARSLASHVMTGDLDRDLAALLRDPAAPEEITVEAASRELAERLGGAAVELRRSTGESPDIEAPIEAGTEPPIEAPIEAGTEPPIDAAVEAPDPAAVRAQIDTSVEAAIEPPTADGGEEDDEIEVDLSDMEQSDPHDAPTSIGEPGEPPARKRAQRASRSKP
jgi:uncharacterized protein (TIGR02266 family)